MINQPNTLYRVALLYGEHEGEPLHNYVYCHPRKSDEFWYVRRDETHFTSIATARNVLRKCQLKYTGGTGTDLFIERRDSHFLWVRTNEITDFVDILEEL